MGVGGSHQEMCPLFSATFMGIFVSVSEITSSSLMLSVISVLMVVQCWIAGCLADSHCNVCSCRVW